MTIRYFVLQASYRGTVDFSNAALQSAEKGLEKLYDADRHLDSLKPGTTSTENIEALQERCYEAMNDDFNTPKVIAELFDAVRIINAVKDGHATLTADDIELLKTTFRTFFFDILGIKPETEQGDTREHDALEKAMQLVLEMRPFFVYVCRDAMPCVSTNGRASLHPREPLPFHNLPVIFLPVRGRHPQEIHAGGNVTQVHRGGRPL